DDACPSGCTGATENGHVYVLCYQSAMSSRVTWAEAASRCAGSLSTAAGVTLELARVESPDENEFLVEWIEDRNLQSGIWMGANDRDVDDSWSWGTGNARVVFFKDDMNGGDAVDDRFNDWGTNPPRPNGDTAMDPTEDCGHFDANISWRWNDAPCEAQPMPGYVCEQVD
ncbi:MAG TPA: C-type lectin domain-containing protein, partial [Polyangiaceae bacterium]